MLRTILYIHVPILLFCVLVTILSIGAANRWVGEARAAHNAYLDRLTEPYLAASVTPDPSLSYVKARSEDGRMMARAMTTRSGAERMTQVH